MFLLSDVSLALIARLERVGSAGNCKLTVKSVKVWAKCCASLSPHAFLRTDGRIARGCALGFSQIAHYI